MSKIWLTSDLHLGHDREFIWGPRGFKSVWENDAAIIKNWNDMVDAKDDVYLLGDVMLGNNEAGIKKLKNLKGDIHIIRGNHDTPTRLDLYNHCYNVVEVVDAKWEKFYGINFYMSHFPTVTSNLEKSSRLAEHIINLYGHTHQKTNFYEQIPFMYHVGVDSHDCKPVLIEDIIKDIEAEAKKCKSYL